MHSSRMRTVRSSGRLSGGGSAPRGVSAPRGRGVCSGGLSAPGGVCSRRGVSALGGGIPACTEADTPRVDRQTPVKT